MQGGGSRAVWRGGDTYSATVLQSTVSHESDDLELQPEAWSSCLLAELSTPNPVEL